MGEPKMSEGLVPQERRAGWLFDLPQDLRFTSRNLLRAPGFTLITVLTIALGVGATTTVFSVMNALLLRGLPLPDPDRVVSLQERRNGAVNTDLGYTAVPYQRYQEYARASSALFSQLAAQRFDNFALRVGQEAIAVTGARTSDNFFRALGLRPAAGQFYTTDHEAQIVISHQVWQRYFGGDASVIGRTVYLDSRPYRLAGVAPRGFQGTIVGFAMGVWLPMRAYAAEDQRDPWVFPIGRLNAGVDIARAAAQISDIAKRIPPEASHVTVHGARLEPANGLADDIRGATTSFFTLLLATALLVLLIASANIAGMMLARAVARRREFAIRTALGGARRRLVRQLLTETLALFLIGGLAGVALSYSTTSALENVSLPIIGNIEFDFAPDQRVLALALLSAALTGLVFGLAPALKLSRPDLVPELKAGLGATDAHNTRGRNVFVGAQVAAAVLLLVVAGLFVRALQRGLGVDPGFDPDGVVIASLNLDAHGYDDARTREFYRQLVERVRVLPGVENVGLAHVVQASGAAQGGDARALVPGQAEGTSSNALHNVVDPAYFRTLRVPILTGRALTDADRAGAPAAAVVNETLARKLWPNENPLGKRFNSWNQDLEVVGVARDGKYISMGEQPWAFVFHAFAQYPRGRMTIHVRTSNPDVLQQLRAEVRALDPNVALERLNTLTAVVGISLLPQRIGALLIGVFGLLGLLLAALGVYGVLAFQVAQRTREIGIRLALGATGRGVLGLVVRQGTRLAAIGAALGLLLSAGVTRYLRAFLFGVSPLDPVTFLAVPATLLAVALLASFIPARRATRVTPMETLRAE